MEFTLATPLSTTDALRISVAVLFGIIIFMSFLYGTLLGWVIKRRDSKNDFHKEPTRVIGGLSVLVIAMVAHEPIIYGVALFIGGLLIASEKFMINLAAIFNSDRKSVHKISEQWKEAAGEDVEQKQEAEAEEGAIIEEVQKDKSTDGIPSAAKEKELKTATTTRLDKIKKVENATLDYLEKIATSPNRAVKKYIESFGSNRDRLIYDAIVIDRHSFGVLFGVEVLYRPTFFPNAFRLSLRRVVERTELGLFPMLIMIVVTETSNLNKDRLLRYKNELKKQYPPDIHFAFYRESEKGLSAVDEEDLLELLKNS